MILCLEFVDHMHRMTRRVIRSFSRIIEKKLYEKKFAVLFVFYEFSNSVFYIINISISDQNLV